MHRQFRLGIPLVLAFLALSLLFNYSFVIAETTVSAPLDKPITTAILAPEPATQPVINPAQESENTFIPPYDMPVPTRPEEDDLVVWQSEPKEEQPLLANITTAYTAKPAVPLHQPSTPRVYAQLDKLGETAVEQSLISQSNTVPTNAPLATTASYSNTLQPIHRNSDGTGLSSSFVVTNTSGAVSNCVIEFYWENGDLLYTEVPPPLNPGEDFTYHLDSASFGETTFYGYVKISSDQPVDATILTPNYGLVSGTVYEDDGTTPYSANNIYITNSPDNEWRGGVDVRADGSYYIGGLSAGDYTVRVNPGYPWASQWYDRHDFHQNANILTVAEGGTVAANIILEAGGLITGTVYADDGTTPLVNINVELEQGDFGTCTDSNGRYTLEGVPYGSHKVRAGGGWNGCTDQQSPYMTEYFNETNDVDQAAWITVTAGTDIITHIDFTMDEGGTISGQVTNSQNGQPMANVPIYASEYDDENYWAGATTDVNGVYTITGLIDNDYRLRMDDWDIMQSGWAQQYYEGQFAHHLADRVTISGGNTVTSIDFALEPGGIITGTVTDADTGLPVANVNVQADYLNGEGGNGSCTATDGTYEIIGIIYGDYEISAANNWNHCQEQPNTYATEFYNEVPTRDQATAVTVSSTPVGSINFTLEPGGSISGRVTDADTGQGLADVQVNLNDYDNDDHIEGVQTDASGYYTITGLVAGDYRAAVNDENHIPSGYAYQYYNQTVNQEDATRITLSASEDITHIDFPLQPGGLISGIIRDDNGQPLANINVDFHSQDGPWGIGNCTDVNGYYEVIAMPYGNYIASAGGWNHCIEQQGIHVPQYYDHTSDWDAAALLTLDDTTPLITNIDFDLAIGGFIAGHVEDDNGDPVPYIHMAALRTSDNQWILGQDADENGDYQIGPLAAGDYYVFACADCNDHMLVNELYDDVYHIADATAVSVGITTTGGIDFVLDPGVLLTGHVTVPLGYDNEGLRVDVWQNMENGFSTDRQTDSNGDYAIPVPPIYDSRWAIAIHPWETDLGSRWAHRFDMNEQTNWDFALELGGIITGCITDGSVPVPHVNVNAESDLMNHGTETDADGCYILTNLPPAAYKINANGWDQGYTEMPYGGHNWDWAQPVYLQAGETLTDIDVDLPQAGQIEGFVTETDGATPIEGVVVTAISDRGTWRGWSQPDGYYTIDVPVGDYKLFFQSEDTWDTVWLFYPDSTTYANATAVSVAPLPAATSADMQLERFASLSGQITDSNSGQPVEGIHVVARNIDPAINRDYAGWGECTDGNGDYQIDTVFPGQTEVIAIGTCGHHEYGVFTDTYTAVAGQHDVVDLAIEATSPAWPFTIHTPQTYDLTPLSSGQSLQILNADQVLPALFAPLVQVDDTGQWFSELLTQVPTEANGGVSIINEQLVVSYTLNTGLLWSDGQALTSADIRFGWEMINQPYPGFDDGLAPYSLHTHIESVTTPDPLTAVVTYEPRYYPAAYLTALLYPMPEHILGGQHPQDIRWNSSYAHNPVGNGPYMVNDWVPGSHMDLVPNPNYHKRSSGLPIISNVRFLFTEHPFWSMMSVAKASLSVTDMPDDFERYDLAIHTNSANGFDAIHVNQERPFFAETQVRQALYHALDRQQFVDEQWPPRIVGDTWLPPDHPMYTSAIDTYSYNLATAASLLDTAGWVDSNGNGTRDKNGVEFEFDIIYVEGQSHRQKLASDFQTDLATIGVDANVIAMPWQDMWDEARYGNLDTWMQGWTFDNRYDPSLSILFHSDSVPTPYNDHHGVNYARWQNATNDQLLDDAHSELDTNLLTNTYQQQSTVFSQDVPIWVTSHYLQYDMAVPTLLNFRPSTATPATWNIEKWKLPTNPYDVSVRKALAANSAAPQPDTPITYEVSVRNAGFFSTTNVTLLDTLPTDVIYQSAVPAPDTITGNMLTWNLGTFAPGDEQVVQIEVDIPATVTHGTMLTNQAAVYADQTDSRPGNNSFQFMTEVQDDVDLAISKSGVGQPAIGEKFQYFLDYANWGGAPAANVVISDTLPAEVNFLSANPTPDSTNGNVLTWDIGNLIGGQWGGQIEIVAEITNSGTVINTSKINFPDLDADLSNNSDDHSENVDDILPPLITQPTQGTIDTTPTVKGLAPSGAVVDLYDISTTTPTWIMSTIAATDGTWSMSPTFITGSISLAAKATKAGLTSAYSNSASITVSDALDIDPDFVTISSSGVDVSAGVVRAERNTLAFRQLDIKARVECSMAPIAELDVTENGLLHYMLPTTNLDDLGGNQWRVEFQLWLADPHSTYNVWLDWTCDDIKYSENLLYILIDPDGYVYDQSLVDGGATITDSIQTNAVVTAFMKVDDTWQVWPAHVYGQTNPQYTDGTTTDGVLEPGYYSFLTPPGQYRIVSTADGFQPYQSPVLTVISDPIHLDIGLDPISGGDTSVQAPVNLARSGKWVNQTTAWVGDVLTYDVWLFNDGEVATASFDVVDAIPDHATYVAGSLNVEEGSGVVSYDGTSDEIRWRGTLAGQTAVHYTYQLTVSSTPGSPFDLTNSSTTVGGVSDLFTLPSLTAVSHIQNDVDIILASNLVDNADPGTSVTYEHTITNNSNFTDTLSFSAVSSAGWATSLPAAMELAPGESAQVLLAVTVPANALYGTVDNTVLTASSAVNDSLTTAITDQTTVNRTVALSLSNAAPQEGEPGTTMTYTHQLQNLGNGADTFTITAVSSQGWSVSHSNNPTLAAGATTTIEVYVTIPANAVAQKVDTTTVTVSSQADSNKTAVGTDITTAKKTGFMVYLPIIIK